MWSRLTRPHFDSLECRAGQIGLRETTPANWTKSQFRSHRQDAAAVEAASAEQKPARSYRRRIGCRDGPTSFQQERSSPHVGRKTYRKRRHQ
jgi:hypothetical protein